MAVVMIGHLAAKRCSTCWVTRMLEDFHDDCSKADGMRSSCKMCCARRDHAYRDKIRAKAGKSPL